LPGIGRDIDNAEDLNAFVRVRSSTRTQAFLDRNSFADWGRILKSSDQPNKQK
jgi:hypothetical protein